MSRSGVLELLQDIGVHQQRNQRAVAEALGVDRSSLEVLYHLVAAGPSSPSELARRTGMTAAATNQVLKRLEAASHLHRRPHPTDGRRVVVTIEPATAARLWEHYGPFVDALSGLVTSLPTSQRETVEDFLVRAERVYRTRLA